VVNDDTAAIMLEPIQSMAGVREADPEFFQDLRRVCDDRGIMLIFDEVQTGVGRTGRWFFSGSEHAGGVVPDIVSLAKSLGSGLPVGACLVSNKVAGHITENDLGTTFGGGMLAMAATLATLEAIEQDDMIANASRVEQHLRDSLAGNTGIVAIHGKGCLLGIEFGAPAAIAHKQLLEKKIIIGTSSSANILRLLPPLCVTTDEVDLLVDALG
jgi:acetylornithine/succinyldiaminopimelate/putrescine aminotransferase